MNISNIDLIKQAQQLGYEKNPMEMGKIIAAFGLIKGACRSLALKEAEEKGCGYSEMDSDLYAICSLITSYCDRNGIKEKYLYDKPIAKYSKDGKLIELI